MIEAQLQSDDVGTLRREEIRAMRDAEVEARVAALRPPVDPEAEKVAAIKDAVAAADPPSAEELGIDVTGLTPGRERLARFQRWIANERDDLARLESQHAEYLHALGVPVHTQRSLNDLVAQDKTGFELWRRRNSPPDETPLLNTFEIEKLRERLVHDQHAAEIATGELAKVHEEIAAAGVRLDALERRRAEFEAGALESEDEVLERKQHAVIAELRAVMLQRQGLHAAIAAARGWRDSSVPLNHALPLGRRARVLGGDRNDPNRIHTDAADIAEASKPWRVLRGALANDPRA